MDQESRDLNIIFPASENMLIEHMVKTIELIRNTFKTKKKMSGIQNDLAALLHLRHRQG